MRVRETAAVTSTALEDLARHPEPPLWRTAGLAGLTLPVLTGGFTGLIAPLVPPPLLRRAYGAESTSYNVAGVAGPALAGAVSAWSPTAAALLCVGLSTVALVAVLRVPMPVPAAPADSLVRT